MHWKTFGLFTLGALLALVLDSQIGSILNPILTPLKLTY